MSKLDFSCQSGVHPPKSFSSFRIGPPLTTLIILLRLPDRPGMLAWLRADRVFVAVIPQQPITLKFGRFLLR